MDTGTFVQQKNQFDSGGVEAESSKTQEHRFVEPKINFSSGEKFLIGSEDIRSIPEMTKTQWKQYYKKMGLE